MNVLSLLGRGAVAGVQAKNATLAGQEEADNINRERERAAALARIAEEERRYTRGRNERLDAMRQQEVASEGDLRAAQAWAARNPRPRRFTEVIVDPKTGPSQVEFDQDDPSYRRVLGPAPRTASSGPTWGQGEALREQASMGETWLQMNQKPEILAEVERIMRKDPQLSRGLAAWRVRTALSTAARDLSVVQNVEDKESDLSLAGMREAILGPEFSGASNQMPNRPGTLLPPAPTTGPYGLGAPRPAAPAAPTLPPVPAGYDADAYYGALVDIGKLPKEQYEAWQRSRRP